MDFGIKILEKSTWRIFWVKSSISISGHTGNANRFLTGFSEPVHSTS